MPITTKVLVVDDSAFMRKVIKAVIDEQPDMKVVGTARDGKDAIEKVRSLRPNIVTLDIEMPNMNGLEALKHIMEKTPTKVIMVSSLTSKNADETIQCLELGAVDFIQKPSGSISLDFSKIQEDLIEKIRAAHGVSVDKLAKKLSFNIAQKPRPRASSFDSISSSNKILLIASSTGGPRSLETIIPLLPEKIGCPAIVVQHMPASFTKSLADRLDKCSNIRVVEASEGDSLEKDTVYIAPGDYHLGVRKMGVLNKLYLDKSEKLNGVRPAADFTFESVTDIYGKNILTVVLTGMGKDGALGVKRIKEKGGIVIAESKDTCVVYGMPKAVVDDGNADYVLPNTSIAEKIMNLLKGR